jgi:hypothetical protein
MPIQLTTPVSGGDFEPAALTHAKIVSFTLTVELKKILLRAQLGSMANSVFQPAAYLTVGATVRDFEVAGEEYDTMVATEASAEGAVLYDEVSIALYQWLIDKGHFAGTIV